MSQAKASSAAASTSGKLEVHYEPMLVALLRQRHPELLRPVDDKELAARVRAHCSIGRRLGWNQPEHLLLYMHSLILLEDDLPAHEPRSEAYRLAIAGDGDATVRIERLLNAAVRARLQRLRAGSDAGAAPK
ncbi:MAG: hypothetical protein HRF50_00675 [Phycisphaerae bacterium]|jgi:hypothetical protein